MDGMRSAGTRRKEVGVRRRAPLVRAARARHVVLGTGAGTPGWPPAARRLAHGDGEAARDAAAQRPDGTCLPPAGPASRQPTRLVARSIAGAERGRGRERAVFTEQAP